MRNLENLSRKEVIKQMSYCFVPKDTIVFNQGSLGNYFYIIKIGKVDLYISNEKKKTLRYGESFGELALLHETMRSGTIKSTEDTYMWCLERKKFKQVINYINNINFEENRKFIKSIPLINNMDGETITRLASYLIKVIYDPNNFIVKEGEEADCIYIIKEGNVECSRGEEVIRHLTKGDFFGVNSVLTETPRSLNVVAKTVCVLYSISVGTLSLILGADFKNVLYLNFIKLAMKNSKAFGKINESLIEKTYPCFKVRRFSKGNIVLSKGSIINEYIRIVIEGNLLKSDDSTNFSNHDVSSSVGLSTTNKIISNRGKIIFDEEFISELSQLNNKLNFDLVADPDCFILEANLNDFTKLIGGSIFNVSEKSSLIEALLKIPLFKNFSEKQIYNFVDAVKIENFKKNKIIIKEKDIGSKFYIVKSGKVDVFTANKYIRTLNENEYFGEKSLFIKEPRSATVVAAEDNVLLYVFNEDVFNNLPGSLRDFIAKLVPLQDDTVELNQLEFVQILGKGNFGNVYLVLCKKNNCLYALKAISRTQIDQEQLHPNIEMERKILLKIDHPFIMKMVKSLKDEQDIYFLTEYIIGKELWDVIRDIGLLNKQQSLFYECSIMLAVDYLHKRKIIYRDIKPENIIITVFGHIKLIDFGTAKEINDRTATIIGTPHYMAPEVILGEGYTFNIDFWSISICLFEFVCGGVPFGESCDDPMDVYTSIVNNDLAFPPFIKESSFKNVMKSLLKKNPVSRLCSLNQIKVHSYFDGFDWNGIESLGKNVPYLPSIPSPELNKSKSIDFIEFIKNNRKKTSNNEIINPNLKDEYEKWFDNF